MWALIETKDGIYAVWNPVCQLGMYLDWSNAKKQESLVYFDECFLVWQPNRIYGYVEDCFFGLAPFHENEILSFEMV